MFTASSRARTVDGRVYMMQMVVVAYDRDHAITQLADAIERHNHRTHWRQQLPMFELMRPSIVERPES